MRNNGKGGMQTARCHGSIICPICGKPAVRVDSQFRYDDETNALLFRKVYMHFTKKGCVYHKTAMTSGEMKI